MQIFESGPSPVHPVSSLHKSYTSASVLRLDLIHPVISGNKWFKLKCYLEEARQWDKKAILTYGGAYSNHIVATAAAAADQRLPSIGLIRGEPGKQPSPTLEQAAALGMQLHFLSRDQYRLRTVPPAVLTAFPLHELYFVNEGGYGKLGAEGASFIGNLNDLSPYTHILAAVGTGTTLAGLVLSALPHQQVIGISVLRNNHSLPDEINELLPAEKKDRFTLLHDFHFGGYAKSNPALFAFMNEWYELEGIPSDFVYTGKLFFALRQLMQAGFFPDGSRVLAIHSGGLQGNRSLTKGTLIF